MDLASVLCIFQNVSLILVTYVVGTRWNCLIEAIPMCIYNVYQFNKCVFFTINFVYNLLNYFFNVSVQ